MSGGGGGKITLSPVNPAYPSTTQIFVYCPLRIHQVGGPEAELQYSLFMDILCLRAMYLEPIISDPDPNQGMARTEQKMWKLCT